MWDNQRCIQNLSNSNSITYLLKRKKGENYIRLVSKANVNEIHPLYLFDQIIPFQNNLIIYIPPSSAGSTPHQGKPEYNRVTFQVELQEIMSIKKHVKYKTLVTGNTALIFKINKCPMSKRKINSIYYNSQGGFGRSVQGFHPWKANGDQRLV